MAVSPVSRVGTASARLMPYFGRDQSLSSQYFSYMPNSQPIAHFFILKNTTNSTQNFDNYSLTVTKNEKFIEEQLFLRQNLSIKVKNCGVY